MILKYKSAHLPACTCNPNVIDSTTLCLFPEANMNVQYKFSVLYVHNAQDFYDFNIILIVIYSHDCTNFVVSLILLVQWRGRR